MPAFQLIMHSLMQFRVNVCLFYYSKILYYSFASRHIMKRYLGLESKSLG